MWPFTHCTGVPCKVRETSWGMWPVSGLSILPSSFAGFPDPEVTWLRGDVPIQESPHLYVAYEENGSCSLTILELTVEDAGQYVCRAVNDVGEAECSARLTVCPQQKVTYV